MRNARLVSSLFSTAVLAVASSASAEMTVSRAQTANVQCAGGVCTATSADAVLSQSDLEAMLAAGDVTVKTGAATEDVVVAAAVTWSGATTLTLDARRSVLIEAPVTVKKGASLTVTTDDGGTNGALSFPKTGHVHFLSLSSALVIDGEPYTLVDSIATLAAGVAAHPKHAFALASDYDAQPDGGYDGPAVPTNLTGTFEGLGNTVSNLYINQTAAGDVGLFASIGPKAVLSNVRLTNIDYWSENTFNQDMGGLVAFSQGRVLRCSATGQIRSDFLVTAGGLVGINYGQVRDSWAGVDVTGAVSAEVGGLIGNSHGPVANSYATGFAEAGDQATVGGLIGYTFSTISDVYATGRVLGGASAFVGGLIGQILSPGTITNGDFDTETTTTSLGVGYGGSTGVTGLTTAALQASLPAGFASTLWGLDASQNGGLPYLVEAP